MYYYFDYLCIIIINQIKTFKAMKALVSKLSTYEAIKMLDNTSGVFVGNWEYHLDGEVETGNIYDLSNIDEIVDGVGVVRVYCSDGWLDATNYKDVLKGLI